MSFRAKLNDPRGFINIMYGIKDLVKDINLDVSSKGIVLKTMDTSHVSLVHLFLKREFFQSFECKNELTIGLNMLIVTRMLKCGEVGDTLTLITKDGTDELKFIFESVDNLKCSDFKMKLIDIDQDDFNVPISDYSAEVRMCSTKLTKICRDLCIVGDSIMIRVEGTQATFSINGETGNGLVVINQDKEFEASDTDGVRITTDGKPVVLTFALKYLNLFCKSSKLDKNVHISLKNGNPLRIEFKLGKVGFMRFYLAPRIEDMDGVEGCGDDHMDVDDDEDDDEYDECF